MRMTIIGVLTMNILIIEDSVVEATLLTKELEKAIDEPIEVQHADTLVKGVASLKEKKKIDLVFLDLGLPDSSGWEQTYESVSPYTDHLPVIVMTSNKNPGIVEELLKRGLQDYIIKGSKKHDPDLLRETITFALLRHKVVNRLSATVREKEQCMNWLSGGYSV
jgi:CheY-like chemotaxis protein